jgi:hypothetical protein
MEFSGCIVVMIGVSGYEGGHMMVTAKNLIPLLLLEDTHTSLLELESFRENLVLGILNVITKSRLSFLILIMAQKMPNLSFMPLKPLSAVDTNISSDPRRLADG